MKVRSLLAAFALLAFAGSLAVGGADEKKGKETASKAAMDEKAMMEAWAKFATPGESHKSLETLVGTWDTKVKMWIQPGAPPQESQGTSENRMTLGGRFLEQRYEGTFMGGAFSGIGYTGYDNFKKKYVGTWMDTAGTSMMNSTGTADGSGKMMTFTGTMDDIQSGKTQPYTQKLAIVDNDHHTFEMWGPDPAGKQYKVMEIHYTKKK